MRGAVGPTLGAVSRHWGQHQCPSCAILGAPDGHEGPNSVTFIQSVILFLLPMSGDHQGISGLDEPTQA